jgi:acetolactate synthase I/II/III large subunit
MNVAEYIAQFLISKNVKHVFGFQGGAILKLIDAFSETNKISYVQNYHEQASSFSADAYSKITGNIGVAIATSGPGAINLIGGIVNSFLDSTPCLFFTGQDYTYNIKKPEDVRSNGFQDLDIVSMLKPVTKYAKTIYDENSIKYELEKAFFLATSGRPGSVVLDIPVDIQFKEVDINNLNGFTPPITVTYELDKVHNVISMIREAKRPVILAGGGIRIAGAQDMFKQFVDLVKIPVVATLNGLDAYNDTLGFTGLFGNSYSNLTILNSDLLLVLGARLGQHHVGKVKKNYTKAKVIHIDIDKSEFNRALDEDLSIYSDLKSFLTNIIKELSNTELPNIQKWYKQIEFWAEKYAENTHINKDGIDPVKFVESVTTFFDNDTIMTADVGQNQMWVAQGVKIRNNQRLLNSTGFGSMGYSLPAAIGAKIAKPKNQVIAFTGDGGLQMNIQELLFVGQKQLDIKIIVFNNNTLGLIRETQKRYFDSKYYGTNPNEFVCADLCMLAKTYGLKYIEVNSLDDLLKVEESLKDKSPYLIEVKISINSKTLNRNDDFKNIEKDIING